MSFTELFIRRPVLSMVVSLLILLLGAQGLMNLQVRQYPEVEETTITITTVYTGASADLIPTDPITGAGVAYVRLAHDPDPVRARAAWVTDADIRAMCAEDAFAPELRPVEGGAAA